MAFFGVTIEKINEIKNHPNSDRGLKIVTLEGMAFQFITNISDYQVGDQVLYFPVDCLLPIDVMRKLDMIKKDEQGNELFDEDGVPMTMLSGKLRNRIKTVRLRQEWSQGVMAPLAFLNDYLSPEDAQNVVQATKEEQAETITKAMGIEKHEPQAVVERNAYLNQLPEGLNAYDIEGADRYGNAVEEIIDLPVFITEKMEGMNYSVSYVREEDKVYVNQRNYTIVPKPDTVEPTFWTVAREAGIIDFVKSLSEKYPENRMVTLYGEFCGEGSQGNIYKQKGHHVFAFDIKVDNRYLSAEDFLSLTQAGGIKTVPVLAKDVVLRDWLAGKTIQEVSDGRSVMADTLREGIVIKPMVEQYSKALHGRLILKQRSPKYLEKTGN